jgi:hypothetical protein
VSLPPTGPVSASITTLIFEVPAFTLWGILHEYPQYPPHPYSILPLAS